MSFYGVKGAPTRTDRQIIHKECSEDVLVNKRWQLLVNLQSEACNGQDTTSWDSFFWVEFIRECVPDSEPNWRSLRYSDTITGSLPMSPILCTCRSQMIQTWQMEFHPDKYQVLRVTNKHPQNITQLDYILHGHTLSVVDDVKYLGLTVSSNLIWDTQIAKLQPRPTPPWQYWGGMFGCPLKPSNLPHTQP